MARKRYEEALVAYEQALRLEPANILASIGKGDALRSLNRYEEALVAYEQALRLEPDNVACLHWQGAYTLQPEAIYRCFSSL